MGRGAWWQGGAIYQIYPRSFADANGDGVGDLAGIIAHLDHVAGLGAEAVWLSPIFPSPMADFGYDVADYCDVDPTFGTLTDLDRLVAAFHARGIRVILDWVPNHTSDRHPWFLASRSSRQDPKRNWYVWRGGAADGGPPNDWVSAFEATGPAWTFDEGTGQWYLHSFLPEQPDLDWDNPDVEAAMHDVLRFWLARGVDGLRLDAIPRIAKDPLLRDNTISRRHDEDWDSIHARVRGIRRVVDEFEDRMIVGEVALQSLDRTVSYLEAGDQLHLAHNFLFAGLPWSAEAFRESIDDFVALAGAQAWPAWFLENHDRPRVVTRFAGENGQGPARARAAALILYALRGTPFIYQGEELGLPDAEIPSGRIVDVGGRDPQRAPMPWRPPSVAGPAAGFSSAEPWLPPVVDAERLCVERQDADERSMLTFVRRLSGLRARTPALQVGEQRMVEAGADVLAWLRDHDEDRIVTAVNFADTPTRLRITTELRPPVTLLLSTDPDRPTGPLHLDDFTLGPNEAVLLRSGSAPSPAGSAP
jgi:alpha-glucosidase